MMCWGVLAGACADGGEERGRGIRHWGRWRMRRLCDVYIGHVWDTICHGRGDAAVSKRQQLYEGINAPWNLNYLLINMVCVTPAILHFRSYLSLRMRKTTTVVCRHCVEMVSIKCQIKFVCYVDVKCFYFPSHLMSTYVMISKDR